MRRHPVMNQAMNPASNGDALEPDGMLKMLLYTIKQFYLWHTIPSSAFRPDSMHLLRGWIRCPIQRRVALHSAPGGAAFSAGGAAFRAGVIGGKDIKSMRSMCNNV